MKKPEKRVATLTPTNAQQVSKSLADNKIGPHYVDILLLFAETLDHAIKGENIYLTFGVTKDKTGCMIVVTWDGDKSYIVAGSLSGLSLEAQSWLKDS